MTPHPYKIQHESRKNDRVLNNDKTTITPKNCNINSLISPSVQFILTFIQCPKNVSYGCFSTPNPRSSQGLQIAFSYIFLACFLFYNDPQFLFVFMTLIFCMSHVDL